MKQKRNLIAAGVGTLALVLAGMWWLTAPPTSPTATVAPPAAPAKAASGIITMTDDQIGRLGIKLAPALQAAMVPLASLPAMIVPPANARVAVAATFAGVITRTLVIEGEAVRRGQPLAIIASREVLMMGAELARSRARLGFAQSNASRLGQLSREGVIAGSRADEAQATLREAQVDVTEKARILALANASGGAGTYTLVAPISGRVTSASLQAGSPVDGSTAPYVIDATDRHEVEAQLPERLVGSVQPGMEIRLDGGSSGTVTSVGATIDPMTRSAMLKASIAASPGLAQGVLAAGKATTITVFAPAPAGLVAVPAAALTTLDGSDIIFIRTRTGFNARPVVRRGSSDGTLIVSGLAVGDRVVITGTSELKSLAGAR
ncbi:efflux RND transporter periplasmic adaptor subunit [Sphingomonas sp. 28-63-12]|uniref:efflux RND transporter periplasmic adaptor subunit n=1 Tax=Sphingomonas sp. 28-63-12 TaxID=1970434 RepID=UPI000BC609EA|nr:MAG: efflux transporter periplasmic adaptor subunit [Sphingomonas sp. 28-63-12]